MKLILNDLRFLEPSLRRYLRCTSLLFRHSYRVRPDDSPESPVSVRMEEGVNIADKTTTYVCFVVFSFLFTLPSVIINPSDSSILVAV